MKLKKRERLEFLLSCFSFFPILNKAKLGFVKRTPTLPLPLFHSLSLCFLFPSPSLCLSLSLSTFLFLFLSLFIFLPHSFFHSHSLYILSFLSLSLYFRLLSVSLFSLLSWLSLSRSFFSIHFYSLVSHSLSFLSSLSVLLHSLSFFCLFLSSTFAHKHAQGIVGPNVKVKWNENMPIICHLKFLTQNISKFGRI